MANYSILNFVSTPTQQDTQIKIYDKSGLLKYLIDPRISYFAVRENILDINIKNQNDIYLDFSSSDEAKQAILKINSVKQQILENLKDKTDYINRVLNASENNISIFDNLGGLKDSGFNINDNSYGTNVLWTSDKVYNLITGFTSGFWIKDPNFPYLYNIDYNVGIGTTIPTERLTVSGNTLLHGALILNNYFLSGVSNDTGLTQNSDNLLVTQSAIKTYVENRVISQSSATTIGVAEDGSYEDGLFVDFNPQTPTGTAVDRFNEVLKALSPPPAPDLSDWNATTTSVSGKISFGLSNNISGYTNVPTVDINGIWNKTGKNLGISNKIGTITGILNNQVVATTLPDIPYNNGAFGDAEKGVLNFILNGSIIDTLDLTITSGSTTSTHLSVSQLYNSKFNSGSELNVFKHRTGTYTINKSLLNDGYNYIEISHIFNTTIRLLTKFEIVIDSNTINTTFSSNNLHTLTMSGSKYLSGVRYHTSGTALYNITISNVYRNTYSSSSSAISFIGTNGSIPSLSIPNCTTENDDIIITNRIFTINANRLLNGAISTTTTVLRTLQGTQTSPSSSIVGILMDSVSETSNQSSLEQFNGETYRLKDNNFDVYGTITTNIWDSTESLLSNSGLQVYNDMLVYPSIDFSTIVNGYVGNPNYSGVSGVRTYYRYFRQISPTTALFKLKINGTNTTFVSSSTTLTGNNAHCWIKIPGLSSKETGWLDVTQNYITDNWNDNDGCKNQTGNFVLNSECLLTIGTKTTANSNGYVILKIEVGSSYSGNLSSVEFYWTN